MKIEVCVNDERRHTCVPGGKPDFVEVMDRSREACEVLSATDAELKREILTHAGNRWSLGIVYALGADGGLRHRELARRLPGISQRMLTRSLRQLERDGLISRTDHGEIPPRVEYTLTDLGRGFLVSMLPIWSWIIDNAEDFRAARERYQAPKAPWLNPTA